LKNARIHEMGGRAELPLSLLQNGFSILEDELEAKHGHSGQNNSCRNHEVRAIGQGTDVLEIRIPV
jgi:hypothetical protein